MSMIQFTCPSCNAQYKVPTKAAGKQATCKSCGKSMTVPNASDRSGTGGADLSGMYGGDPVAPPAIQAGSVFGASSSRRSGPSPMLLAGIGGGVFLLILVVVLVVVLMGMGGDDKPTQPVATNNTPSADRGRGGSTPRDTTPRGTGNGSGTRNGGDAGDNGGETETNQAPPAHTIDPPAGALAGVRNWSLPVSARLKNVVDEAEFRGMIFALPPDWQSETQDMAELVRSNDALEETLTEAFGNEVMETAFFQASPRESLVDFSIAVIVSRDASPKPWPEMAEVERFSNALQLNNTELQQLRDSAGAGPATAILDGVASALAGARGQNPYAFNVFKPRTCYLKRGTYDRVTFGTLFDGHPFARVVFEEGDTQILLYTGHVEDVRVTFIAQAPTQYSELIDDMDWIMRSARLMNPQEANSYGRSDSIYQMWMNDRFVDVAYAGDNVPFGELSDADWEGFSERSIFTTSAATASVVSPLRQPYGITPPEGMRLASVNRIAARWFPNNNGLWLQLKVTKLEGRDQRTMTTPVMPPDEGGGPERLFVNSTVIPLPDDYEYTQFVAGTMTVHRVLMPQYAGSNIRKVYYVLFDGANQVTVEGRYDSTRPEDLGALDLAAQSLVKN